jgi:hypothetical protein
MTHYISRENNKLVFKTNSLEKMTIDNDGNINVTNNLDVNGTFNVSGNNGFSGNIVAYTGGRSGGHSATNIYAYGNGASNTNGIVMPSAGKVIAISVSCASSSTATAQAYSPNLASVLGSVSLSSSVSNYAIISSSNTFSAGDRIYGRISSGTMNNTGNITFWVKFD